LPEPSLVALNLIMNGVEAMTGIVDRSKRLLIRSVSKSGEIAVSVSGTGIGVDREQLGGLFDPFFTNQPCGIGAGLSISPSLTEAHGGKLWAMPNKLNGDFFQFPRPARTTEQ
jgi:C4-dicarboxylate-specific signal transduction histidine kinase